MHRRILALVGFATLFVGVALGVTQTAAGAHHAILSGVPSCSNGDHLITWSIGNSQAKEDMTVLKADAVLLGSSYAVTGYVNPIPPSGSTSATSTFPGSLVGTVTITVTGHWTDGHHSVRSADVDLSGVCTVTTTTLPATTTTTSAPPTTVTTPKDTTTTSLAPPVTDSGGGSGTGTPLAYTGGDALPASLVGAGLVGVGLALLPPRRRRRG